MAYALHRKIRDIEFDTYNTERVFFSLVNCNYPEASKTSTVDIDGFRLVMAEERDRLVNPFGIASNAPGNWSIRNVVAEDHYTHLPFLRGTVMFAISAGLCNPDDGLLQTVSYENISLSLNNDNGSKNNILG